MSATVVEEPTREETLEESPEVQEAKAEARAEKLQALGLWLAPVFIAALAGILYLYHQSLDIGAEGGSFQQASALSWSDKLWPQTVTHLQIAAYSTVLVVLTAIPLGIALTRPGLRRVSPAILSVANAGQALPAYGLLILFLTFMGLGQATAVYALALYALLPVLRNTMVGLDQVDRSLIEAGRGMGLTKFQVLTRIELPLAVPVIIAGVRIAMTINIGMATLAFLIDGGGLGITINSGLKLQQDPVLIVGATLVALVALTFDWIGAVAERFLHPRGL